MKHNKNQSGICPVCSSDNVGFDGSDNEGDYIVHYVDCHNCGVRFEEISDVVYAESRIRTDLYDLKELLRNKHEELLEATDQETIDKLKEIIKSLEETISEESE